MADRMGNMFRQDAYVPVPRRDPRRDEDVQRFFLNQYDRENPYGDSSGGSLSRAAGIEDIDPRRPYPRPGNLEFQGPTQPVTDEDSRNQMFPALQGISRMINPERFSDVLARMPESRAPVIYEPSFWRDRGRF